jgi:hypothetical protein
LIVPIDWSIIVAGGGVHAVLWWCWVAVLVFWFFVVLFVWNTVEFSNRTCGSWVSFLV